MLGRKVVNKNNWWFFYEESVLKSATDFRFSNPAVQLATIFFFRASFVRTGRDPLKKHNETDVNYFIGQNTHNVEKKTPFLKQKSVFRTLKS